MTKFSFETFIKTCQQQEIILPDDFFLTLIENDENKKQQLKFANIKKKYSELLETTGNLADLEYSLKSILREVNLNELDIEFRPISKEIEEYVYETNLDEFLEKQTIIPTGFDMLDDILNGGFKDSQFCLIGARPSVGKTSFSLNMFLHMVQLKKNVVFYSVEMTSRELKRRLLQIISMSPPSAVYKKHPQMLARYIYAVKELAGMETGYIDDVTYDIDDIVKNIHARKEQDKIDIAIIDYLQLITIINGKKYNREQEVRDISQKLKMTAKTCQIPIIILAQLNRDLEKRGSKKPQLSDLRGSGALEQDADTILFLYRSVEEQEPEVVRGLASYINLNLLISKNRNGRVGEVNLEFLPDYQKFQIRKENYEKIDRKPKYDFDGMPI